MKNEIIQRGGEEVIQVRSDAGKLLYVKTKQGYELKCSRSKQVCLVKYEEMLSDCLTCLREKLDNENEEKLIKDVKLRKLLEMTPGR